MNAQRFFRHLLTPGWWARRVFRSADRAAIREAVAASERTHRGEIRFAVEGPLALSRLVAGQEARARAAELFAHLGVGNTREASGVLIYVQLVDRGVEIVVDSGIAERVDQIEWERICRDVEVAFAQGAWRRGALEAIDSVGRLLSLHFPARGDNPNELDDAPLFF